MWCWCGWNLTVLNCRAFCSRLRSVRGEGYVGMGGATEMLMVTRRSLFACCRCCWSVWGTHTENYWITVFANTPLGHHMTDVYSTLTELSRHVSACHVTLTRESTDKHHITGSKPSVRPNSTALYNTHMDTNISLLWVDTQCQHTHSQKACKFCMRLCDYLCNRHCWSIFHLCTVWCVCFSFTV